MQCKITCARVRTMKKVGKQTQNRQIHREVESILNIELLSSVAASFHKFSFLPFYFVSDVLTLCDFYSCKLMKRREREKKTSRIKKTLVAYVHVFSNAMKKNQVRIKSSTKTNAKKKRKEQKKDRIFFCFFLFIVYVIFLFYFDAHVWCSKFKCTE